MDKNITGEAIVFTNGLLHKNNAKTAHGLIRGSDRFVIKAIVDPAFEGRDAGEVMDGIKRNIPVVKDIDQALAISPTIKYAIVGIAPVGGKLPDPLKQELKLAALKGLNLVSGLHEYISDQPEIVQAASQTGVSITDIRKPKSKSELHFWTGKIIEVKCLIVAVLGMDCAMGKRSTTRFLVEACTRAGIKAEMIYTGQTGWMQSGKYGFVLDSTYNDFVAGELEHAIFECWTQEHPHIIFIEGQSGLRNPSGPCGSEMLISGRAKHVILLVAPKRKYYDDDPLWGEMPSIESEIDLIKAYGSTVMGIALNTSGCSKAEAYTFQKEIADRTTLPVALPLEEGVQNLVSALTTLL